jgi:hypothetical protein
MRQSDFDIADFSEQIFKPVIRTLGKRIQKRLEPNDSNKYSKWRNFAKKGLGYAGKGLNYLMTDHSKDGGIDWLGLAEKGVGLAAAFL